MVPQSPAQPGEAPRARTERPDMTGSAWFTLSLGRKHRAEPKWILPLICKAGNITRDDVGSIKVFDEETRFQISAAKAASYAETVARDGSGENGVTIAPAGSAPRQAPSEKPAYDPQSTPASKPEFKPKFKHKGKAKEPSRFKPEKRSAAGKGFKAKKRGA